MAKDAGLWVGFRVGLKVFYLGALMKKGREKLTETPCNSDAALLSAQHARQKPL
jgi:hypothetical protein